MTIEGVGPQHARAAEGTDPRGWLVFEFLPDDLQRLEDSRLAADRDAAVMRPRPTDRPATVTEVALLEHLGYQPGPDLVTTVSWPSKAVRRRRWLALETEES